MVGVLLVVQCAALAADHVLIQAMAAQAARVEAVGQPAETVLRRSGATGPGARLRVSRGRVPGDPAEWVRVEVRVRSRAFRRAGANLEVVGRAAARSEEPDT